MKRITPLLVLLGSFSPLLSCGASFETRGFEDFGLISESTKASLRSAIVDAVALNGLQRLLFLLDIDGPTTLDPIECADGGSSDSSFTTDLEPVGELSSGDRVRVEFDGCTDGDSVLDGVILFEFGTVIGDTSSDGAWSVSATLTVEDYVRAEGDSQRLSNGTLALELEHQGGELRIDVSGSMSVSISDGLGTRTRLLDDLELEWVYSEETGLATLTIECEFRVETVEGVFALATVEPLVGAPFDVPDTGELRLTGAEGASLSMVVTDGQVVRVRLDLNGDGVIDDVESLLWEAL